MPSFVCDHCQETLKKAKLDQHAQHCRQAAFSCIDCYKTFKGTEYRAHSSCITEVQKHHTIKNKQGQLVKGQPAKAKEEDKPLKLEPVATPVKAEKTPRDLILSKLSSKTPLTVKELKKAIKKDDGDKKARKEAKKFLKKSLKFSLDASGKNIIIKLD